MIADFSTTFASGWPNILAQQTNILVVARALLSCHDLVINLPNTHLHICSSDHFLYTNQISHESDFNDKYWINEVIRMDNNAAFMSAVIVFSYQPAPPPGMTSPPFYWLPSEYLPILVNWFSSRSDGAASVKNQVTLTFCCWLIVECVYSNRTGCKMMGKQQLYYILYGCNYGCIWYSIECGHCPCTWNAWHSIPTSFTFVPIVLCTSSRVDNIFILKFNSYKIWDEGNGNDAKVWFTRHTAG